MPDYKKVIEGLKHCRQGAKGCINCPYAHPNNACQWMLMDDALELLKKLVPCQDCSFYEKCEIHDLLINHENGFCSDGERKNE